MRWTIVLLVIGWIIQEGICFWDQGTTTEEPEEDNDEPRESFFRWMWVGFDTFWFFFPTGWGTDYGNLRRRALSCVVGISIEFLPITTGVLLNRRMALTSATPFDRFMTRQRDLRIWAPGRGGYHNTPYRYRMWQIRRVLPRSVNPEHQIGPRGTITSRHDLALAISEDQIYIWTAGPLTRYFYATKCLLTHKKATIDSKNIYHTGSGFINLHHVKHNFRIRYHDQDPKNIINCEYYLPKWWGKHICLRQNNPSLAGIQNGGSLMVNHRVMAIGNFEIRYNEDRIGAYTDIRYYLDWLNMMANITYGEYYDYAYQMFGVQLGWLYDGHGITYFQPREYVVHDLYPLGK